MHDEHAIYFAENTDAHLLLATAYQVGVAGLVTLSSRVVHGEVRAETHFVKCLRKVDSSLY